MKLEKILKDARSRAGVTTRKAAKNIGLSIAYLNDLEHGRATKPKMKYLYSIASYYGLDFDILCIAAERIPQDVYYKVIRCPELFAIIRNHPEA